MKEVRQSKPRKDLTNKKFGNLTPIYYIKGGKWHCKCDCGNEVVVDTRNLKTGHTKSCGCLQIKKAKQNVVDMSDFENEHIKVLNRKGSDTQQVALWECLCKHCGNTFITRGSSIRAGYINSCGCTHSYNEQLITQLLIEQNIEFATQYTFPNLKGKNNGALRFDFAIFNKGQLSHLIEFNGSQHYDKPEGKWSESFNDLQEHDILKKEYCEKNNIRLIIIPFDKQYSFQDLM